MHTEERIWQEYRKDLLQFLIARTHDPDLARELVQETLIKAYESRNTLSDLNKLKPWLFAIARNKLVDHYRNAGRFEPFQEGLHDREAVEEKQEDENISGCLAALVRGLPAIYRDAVLLSDLQGQKQKYIADHLGLSLSGAKSRVQRGRAMLKERLFSCCPLTFDDTGIPTHCQAPQCR